MHISRKNSGVRLRLDDLNAGDVFRYKRHVYILSDHINSGNMTILNLRDGKLSEQDPSTIISFVKATVNLE
jgi:hypothetical protein